MCLLIKQSKDTNFTEEHLLDFYSRNRDGIGVMWAEDGKLCYEKHLPINAQDAVDFYNRAARGKNACVHYRMKTHGNIDMENCHPYPVFGFEDDEHEMPVALMHNGVLHTGNDKDVSKSDTWHYIRNYLRPMCKSDTAFMFTKEFAEVIGRHIGNNRFAIMNHLGEINIVNESQGVEFNGAWLSNEYAWSAHKYLPAKSYTYANWSNNNWKGGDVSSKKPVIVPTHITQGGGKKSMKKKINKAGLTVEQAMQQTKDVIASLPSTNNGGKVHSPTTLLTKAEKNVASGVSVDSIWLDDVLEMRAILDAVYVDNGTSNKQLECLIEEVGVEDAYYALEMLTEGYMTLKTWDVLSSNRHEANRFFAAIDASDLALRQEARMHEFAH